LSMEDEIDLRAYVTVLLEYKRWIAGLAAVSASVALVVSLFLPPVYQATALVAIIEPRYAMEFDPRVQTVSDIQPAYNAYPALALGDGLVSEVVSDLGADLHAEERSVYELRKMLDAVNGNDPSIIELTVRDEDPERTSRIANRWAELFVKSTNQLYGESDQDQAFFEAQLQDAETALAQAEQDLIEYQSHNDSAFLETQLNNQRASFNEYLGVLRSLQLIVEDARSLQDRLRTQDPSAQVFLSDELAALLLEMDAFRSLSRQTSFLSTDTQGEVSSWQNMGSGTLPLQIQITDQASLGDRQVAEQIAFLSSLVDVLEARQVTLEADAEALRPGMLALQGQLQQVQTEGERLFRSRNIAQETYMTLSRKVAETRISAQDETGNVRLVSRAAVPSTSVSPRKALNTVVGGVLGLFVGILGAFAVAYWQQGKETPAH
jgi:uncharacterized protein involved in exopolysaccharide biosynthesis